MTNLSTTTNAREKRARRLAARDGLTVSKHRTLGYFVTNAYTNYLESGEYGMDLDELEGWLRD